MVPRGAAGGYSDGVGAGPQPLGGAALGRHVHRLQRKLVRHLPGRARPGRGFMAGNDCSHRRIGIGSRPVTADHGRGCGRGRLPWNKLKVGNGLVTVGHSRSRSVPATASHAVTRIFPSPYHFRSQGVIATEQSILLRRHWRSGSDGQIEPFICLQHSVHPFRLVHF